MSDMSKREKKAYAIANNALYFEDSSDYATALWQVLYTLNPELEEYPDLEYIKETEDE